MPKIKRKMLDVLRYVDANPKCSKLDAANHAWGRGWGRMSYRYAPVNRCIELELINATRDGNTYQLTLSNSGRVALEEADDR
jgi:hypothetical protein